MYMFLNSYLHTLSNHVLTGQATRHNSMIVVLDTTSAQFLIVEAGSIASLLNNKKNVLRY